MNELVFQEIANEIKGLHRGAIEHIKRGEYKDASLQYHKALLITDKIGYAEGAAMTLFSMANLSLLKGELMDAFQQAVQARQLFEGVGESTDDCDKLLKKMAIAAKKKGIETERAGRLRTALQYFELCVDYLDSKSKPAVEYEIKLLKKYVS